MSARILRAFFIRKILDTRLSLSPPQELTALALWSGEAPAGAVPSGPVDQGEDHMPIAPMPRLPSS